MSNSEKVVDRAKSSISDLWKKEDYWAIWIGFVIILFSYFYFVEGYKVDYAEQLKSIEMTIATEETKPFETIALIEANADKKALQAKNEPGPKKLLAFFKTPNKWTTNPLSALMLSENEAMAKNAPLKENIDKLQAKADLSFSIARSAEGVAAEANYQSTVLNTAAEAAVKAWKKDNSDLSKAKGKLAKPYNLIPNLIILGFIFSITFSIGAIFMGWNVKNFFIGFWGVYALTLVAAILGKQSTMGHYGLNTEVWAIILGMIVANTVGTPKWMVEGVQVEYFIKTGLVCLGAEVLFNKLLAIGVPGIFVAWVVTPIVLVTTYIFGQKVLKIESKTLNITISSDMSVCGTSAAIAAASACGAKKEELTLAIGLSLTFTAIMMIAIPAFANAVGMPEVLAGAWIGGTVDSTGAVAAAGALIGPKAMQVAATIKMIQNILIGVTAFFIALYWTTKVDAVEGQKVGIMEIWHRFPKFVLGFLTASVVCSIWSADMAVYEGVNLTSPLIANGMLSITKAVKSWCFALAFLSIGLATDFRALAHYFKGGKPVILYVCGQSFNLALTLFMAWVMFYNVFPEITASI